MHVNVYFPVATESDITTTWRVLFAGADGHKTMIRNELATITVSSQMSVLERDTYEPLSATWQCQR